MLLTRNAGVPWWIGSSPSLLASVAICLLLAEMFQSPTPVSAQCTNASPCNGLKYQNTGNCGGNTNSPCCVWANLLESCFPWYPNTLPDGSVSTLLPFGTANGDVKTFSQGNTGGSAVSTPTSEGRCDDCFWQWSLATAGIGGTPLTLPFYGKSYGSLYINNNGLLSFTKGVQTWDGIIMPTACCGPMIAVYWADVDTRSSPSGVCYNRVVTDATTLRNYTDITKRCFNTVKTFNAQYALIVSWDAVGVFDKVVTQLNTFQVMITSDGSQSYIMFNYGWKAQQWAKGSMSTTAFPQVGFDAGDGKNYFNAIGTQTAQMLTLWGLSNAQPAQPGRQCFKIDSANIGSPIIASKDANLTNLVANGGFLLQPLYQYFVDTYTIGVTNGWNLRFTPTQLTDSQTTTVQGQTVGSDVASQPILITSQTTVTVITTADDGITTRQLVITVVIVPSADAKLIALGVQGYTFSQGAFDSSGNTYAYSLALPSSVSQITLTGTTSATVATVVMGPYGPFGGSFSIPNIATVVGTTIFRFNCTAENGRNWLLYTITLTITPSSDAQLKTLTNSPGYPVTLTTPNTTYAVTVLTTDGALSITATANYPSAVVQINGDGFLTGSRTDTVVLNNFGITAATIQVRAEAGSPTNSYTLNINRPYSNNADLIALSLATDLGYPVAINPSFSSGTTSYTADVASWTAGVTASATLSDATYASMTVGGVSLGSGSTTSVITLNTNGISGATTVVTVRVQAQDGTIKQYSVTITKPAMANINAPAPGSCASNTFDINRNEYQTIRVTYTGGEVLQIAGVSNVTAGAPQLWVRLNTVPVVGGVMGTDFNSRSSSIGSSDDYSSATVLWAQSGTYYVTFTPSTASAPTKSFKFTISACNYVSTNITLFGSIPTSSLLFNRWNFFSVYPTATQTVAGVLFQMSSTVALANPNDQYFYTYAKLGLNPPYPAPADAPTFFGAVVTSTNPVQNAATGSLSQYTGLALAPTAGSSRVLFGVYAKPHGVIAPLASYTVTVNATIPSPSIVLAQPLTGPTTGGTIVTIQGSYFEPLANTPCLNGQATIGGVACTALSYSSSGDLLCTVPAGQGTGLEIYVTLFGLTTPKFALTYSYNPPTINTGGVTWTSAPTSGNGTVTITGTNFGTAATATINLLPCTVLSRIPQTQIICLAPAGQGSVSVAVNAAGQPSSNSGTYTYDSPVLQWSSCANTATTGNNTLTIAGLNFGTSAATVSVTVGGLTCRVVSWNHTRIFCLTPAGAGASQAIAVQINSLNPVIPPSVALTFTYLAPVLVSISPNPFPPVATTLTVSGSGFSTPGFSLSMTALGGSCTSIQNRNDTFFTCTAPARSIGVPANPSLTVAGQPSNSIPFGYASPVLYALTPLQINPSGGDRVQISGLNLAGVDPSLSLDGISLGGSGSVLVSRNDTVLIWNSPALTVGSSGLASNLPIQYFIGGLSSNTGVEISYLAPIYSGISFTGVPSTQPCTDGLCTASITGSNFGNGQTQVVGVVSVGSTTCAVTAWTNNLITCTYPAGTGTTSLRVTRAGQSTASVLITYRAPTVSTLSPAGGVSTGGGDTLQIDGNNFGVSQPANSNVTIYLRTGPVLCSPITSWSNTRIRCATPIGNGTALTVTVFVAGQSGSISTFQYSNPTITGVTASSFPTSGLVPITITGTSLDGYGSVTVNSVNCPVQTWSQTVVTCLLPAGGGSSRGVVLTTYNSLPSNSYSINYDVPNILAPIPTTLTQAGQVITLAGNNFGNVIGQTSVAVSGVSGTNTITFSNHTHIVFTLGGTPTTSTVTITVTYQSQPSNAFGPVSVSGPTISSTIPTNGPTIGSYNLTVLGGNFGDGVSRPPTVTVGSAQCTPIYEVTNFNRIVCAMPAGVDSQPVKVQIGTQPSGTVTFQYDNPKVISVTPNVNLPTGGGSISITVIGTSFGASGIATVTVGSASCSPIQSSNHTVIICTLPAGLGQNVPVAVRVSSLPSNTDVTVSYIGPAITNVNPALGSTSGGSLVITGTNFGPGGSSAGSVTVGGVDCPVTLASYTPTSITCALPVGAGSNLPVQVTVNGAPSNLWPFGYTGPIISTVTAQTTATTTGGFVVIIAGSNFGPASLPGQVSVNGTGFCSIQPGGWASGQVSCLMPAGAGTVSIQLTTGRTAYSGSTVQTSPAVTFTYAGPSVTGVTPSNGPTAGSTAITIAGSNFYTDKTRVAVTVGGNPATVVSVTDTAIQASTPEGLGGAVSVGVTVYNQPTSFNSFTYDAAVVSGIQLITDGATNALLGGLPASPLLVSGINFGSSSASVAININGQTCSSVTFRNHTAAICNSIPNGVGKNLPVQININGAGFTTINSLFSYAVPVITSITSSGCSTSGNTVIDCPILGSVPITLTGQYFGPTGSSPSVSVNGVGGACTSPTYNGVLSGTQIVCTLPQGTGFNIPVVVTVGTQSSNSLNIAYAGPRLTTNSFRVPAYPAFGTGTVSVALTNGSYVVHFDGTFLSPWYPSAPTPLALMFGTAGVAVGAKEYYCNVTTYSNTFVECTLPALAIGSGLKFYYNDGRQWSPESVDTISFPAPRWVDASIQNPAGSPGTHLPGASSQGEFIQFLAANVGSDPSRITVYYDLPGGAFNNPAMQCTSVSLITPFSSATGYTKLQCRTQTGDGGPYVFKIRALNQWSAEGHDTYKYPDSPIVYRVSGGPNSNCTDIPSLNSTVNCLTSPVNGILTIYGMNFGTVISQNNVLLGTASCPVQTAAATVLTCLIPAGTGLNVPVSVFSNNLVSQPANLFSYAKPVVTSVTGCADQMDGSTRSCNRLGAIQITITGQSFGPSGAFVFVGAKQCLFPVQLSDSQLTCFIQSGTTQNAAVLVIQASGVVSSTVGSLSYAQCPISYYQASSTDFACTIAPAGSYADVAGLFAPKACSPGTWSAQGAAICENCLAGTYQPNSNAQGCLDCQEGKFADSPAQASCSFCASGQFATGTKNIACSGCPAGTQSSGVSGNITVACTNCTAGYISTSAGANCQACPPGQFQPGSGQTRCVSCDSGSYQSGQGSASCVPADKGFYVSAPGQVAQTACNAGSYTNITSQVTCEPCPAGQWAHKPSANTGATVCQFCAPGTYIGVTGAADCLSCPKGSFSSGWAAVACTACPAGSISASVGAATCTNCTAGTVATASGLDACSACAPGSYSPSGGAAVCTPCELGKYNPLPSGTACIPCGVGAGGLGQVGPTTGQASCVACAAGSYQDQPGLSACIPCSAGSFASSPHATRCDGCSAGTFAGVSNQAGCTDCPAGKFSNTSASICTPCAEGSFSAPRATTCTKCVEGQYAPSQGSVACVLCPVGTYSNVTGAAVCRTCWAGTQQPSTGASRCTDCTPGSITSAPGQVACTSCPIGSFASQFGMNLCKACPGGTYAAAPGSVQCTNCTAGSVNAAEGQGSCGPCSVGSFSGSDQMQTCEGCPPGWAAGATGLTRCDICTSGKFSVGYNNRQCSSCPVGRYQPYSGTTYCAECTQGSVQPNTGQPGCSFCLAGTIQSSPGQTDCTPCPVGQYSPYYNMTYCQQCDAGSFAAGTGLDHCTPCDVGTVAAVKGLGGCTACPIGKYQNATASLKECFNCPAGKHQNSPGQTSCDPCLEASAQANPGSALCDSCAAGTYADVKGLSECKPCPAGSFCPAPSTNPQTCALGSYTSSGQQAVCLLCPSGEFSNTSSAISCQPCKAGTFSVSGSTTGATACTACTQGSFAIADRAVACDACPAGSIAPSTGQSRCDACQAGTYQPNSGRTNCIGSTPGYYVASSGSPSETICGAGTYSVGSNNRNCTLCDPGSVQPTPPATDCNLCARGKYMPSFAQGVCLECDSGRYSNVTGMSMCYQCPVGMYSQIDVSGAGKSRCESCDIGKFAATVGSAQCNPCPARTYADRTGLSQCIVCPVGRAMSGTGAAICDECLPGKYAPNENSLQCTLCSTGSFSSTNRATICTPCAAGSYANETGSSECRSCPAGKSAFVPGSVSCEDCGVGFYSQVQGQPNCTACPVGTAQPDTGKSFCVPCTAGSANPFTGQQACFPCAGGMYAEIDNLAECRQCSPGSYAPSTGYSTCPKCFPGRSNPAFAQTACFECGTGSYINDTARTDACTPCEVGKYQSQKGQSTCVLCTNGTAAGVTGRATCDSCLAGHYARDPGQSTCVECEFGTAQPLNSQSSCDVCIEGKSAPVPGSATCTDCTRGSVSRLPGRATCDMCDSGEYQDQSSQSSCKKCSAGYYQPSKRAEGCIDCEAGKYANETGSVDCRSCPEGTFQSVAHQSSCTPCLLGEFNAQTNQLTCQKCGTGRFTDQTGALDCQDCIPGKFQGTNGQSSCEDCPIGRANPSFNQIVCAQCGQGRFRDSTGNITCEACPVGRATASLGSTACTNCTIGRFMGSTGQFECQGCLIGKFANSTGVSVCTDCFPGSYQIQTGKTECDLCKIGKQMSSPGQTFCSDCAAGTYTDLNGTIFCTPCEPGYSQGAPGRTSCAICEKGLFQSRPSQTSCSQCPPSTFGNTTGLSQCFSCPAGRFEQQFASTACSLCGVGYYQSSEGQTACLQCPVGTFTNVNGSISCTRCGKGQYQLLLGQTKCDDCPEGSETDAEGQAVCVGCVPGSFSNGTGASFCFSCDRGKFQDNYNQKNCKLCTVGSFQGSSRQTACNLCGTGRYGTTNGSFACDQCVRGSFNAALGKSSCGPCQIGTYAGGDGASVCLACAAGSFGNVTGLSDCYRCGFGTFQASAGQMNCTLCPLGTFQIQTGQGFCTSCPLGHFGNTTGSQTCLECPIGTYADQTGQTACKACQIGTYSDRPAQPACTLCFAGTYTATNGSTSCKPCVEGDYQRRRGETACEACGLGEFSSLPAATVCSQCSPGTYTDLPARTICLPCGVGSFSVVYGRNSCDACPLGYFGTAPGQSKCQECQPGSWGNATGIQYCAPCAPGYSQLSYGQTVCDKCLAGTYAEREGASVCTSCAAGSFSNLNASTTCGLCPNATYNPISGQTLCQDCPIGKSANKPGLLSCVDCAPGTFANETFQSDCRLCDYGHYQNIYAATACLECQISQYQDQPGQTACLFCQVGRYGVANASQSCAQCPTGQYQPTTGKTECVDCEVGKSNRLPGQAACADCGLGQFGNTTKAVQCFDCPIAQFQDKTGQRNCTDCPVGSFNLQPGVPSCTLCPAGQFQNVSGSTFCYGCEIGSAQPQLGQTACLRCDVGSFNSVPSAQACSPCSAGSFNPWIGQSECRECDYGTYQDAFGASVCANCSVGTFANVPGKTSCSDCGTGRYQHKTGQIDCDWCFYGSFADEVGSTDCTLCRAGSANQATGASSCALCAPGSTTVAPGSWNCTACAKGKAQPLAGQQNCTTCGLGSFSAVEGQQTCTQCQVGRFANVTGLTACSPCEIGKFMKEEGGAECEPCARGSFAVSPGASICGECEAGRYTPYPGAVTCVGCPIGTASEIPGAPECTPCVPGKYALDEGRSQCADCDVGTFNAINGSTQVCTACPEATYQPNTGASFCGPCGVGKANPSTRQSDCTACQAGHYANVTGLTGCSKCAPGSHQSHTGETACTLCEEGSASNVDGLADCIQCASGKVTALRGQLQCTDCAAGYQQPLTGQKTCVQCPIPRFSDVPGESLCALCPAGTFGNRTGQLACNKCPAGYYQDRYGQVNCLPCEAGFSTNRAEGLGKCLFCPDGQANANTAAAACVVCIQTATPSYDRKKCECLAGYYQPYYVAGSNDFVCDECPTGADCTVNGRSWTNLPALSGWWRPTNVSLNFYRCLLASYCVGGEAVSNSLTETSGSGCAANRQGIMCSHCREGYQSAAVGAACEACPDSAATSASAVLLGLLFLALLILQFWYILKSGDGLMKRVLLDDRARAADGDRVPVDRDIFGEDNKDEPPSKVSPADGAGDLSESEAESVVKEDPAQGKEEVPEDEDSDDDDEEAAAAAAAAGTDFAVDAEIRKAEKAAKKQRREQYRKAAKATTNRVMSTGPEPPKPDFTYKLKIFLGFLQIVTNLGTGLQIQWPPSFKEFVSAFDIANFQNIINQATSVECVASYSYYVQYVVIVLSPIAVTVLVFLFYLFPRYAQVGPCCRFVSPAAQQRSKMRFWRLTLYVVFLIYPGVSSTVLRHYICVPIDGTPYLFADLRVQCYTQTWNLFALVSIILVLLYPIGIPLFFFSLLRVNKDHLNAGRTKLQLGFLYAGYHLKVWWFEMIDMTHKLFVTSLLALFPADAQLPVGMFVVCAYAMVLLVVHPYIRSEDDQLHLFCQIEVFLLLCVGYVFYSLPANASYTSFDDTVITVALLAICAFFIGLFVWYAVSTLYKMIKSAYKSYQRDKAKAAHDAANPKPDPNAELDQAGAKSPQTAKSKSKPPSDDEDDESSDDQNNQNQNAAAPAPAPVDAPAPGAASPEPKSAAEPSQSEASKSAGGDGGGEANANANASPPASPPPPEPIAP